MSETVKQWYGVSDFPITYDLSPLLLFLQQQQIATHVTDEGSAQRLWINNNEQVEQVAAWAGQWVRGELSLDSVKASQSSILEESQQQARRSSDQLLRSVSAFPITMICIIAGMAGALLVEMHQSLDWAYWLLFQIVDQRTGSLLSLEDTLQSGQYWRLVTPIFLHFGLMHIIFNSLILWELGRRIEYAKGSAHLLLVLLLAAVVSNMAQYFVSPNTTFGGLSGVNYALVGYVALYQRFIPNPVIQFNQAAILFLIAWLLLGVFGVIDWFMEGGIANGAHVAGLIIGILIVIPVIMRDKQRL